MEYPKLTLPLSIAVAVTVIFLTAWELHWRSKPDYYHANVDDDRDLWAQHRAKLETATEDDVVIIGASRMGFSIRTRVWEEVQGVAPINLSTDGKTPGPFLVDIVDNTSFNGTLVIGVPTFAFFVGLPGGRFYKEASIWTEYYHKQTYAQKLGFFISKQLQRHLVMLTSSELDFYNDLDLKSLVNTIPLKGRPGGHNLHLLKFGYNDEERNLIMFPRLTEDPAEAKAISDYWAAIFDGIEQYKEGIQKSIPPAMEFYDAQFSKFKARGGKIILVRTESEGIWLDLSKELFPREIAWDKLLERVNVAGYHFEDHPFMSRYDLPEWSHMSDKDAHTYTRDLVNKMIEDGHLKRFTK